jgi:uridylate kinase
VKYVISLGGSIINAGTIDVKLLKELKELLHKSKNEFVIVCGGGKIARDYIKAGEELDVASVRLDEIGIKATELNAELVSAILNVRRARTIEEAVTNEKIIVTNGLFPGVTTDFDAVVIAGITNADAVINLSNVPGVYDKDPRNNPDAKFLSELSYETLINMASKYELGKGANFIFDLTASELSQRTKVKFVFIEGLKELELFINNKKFKGSIIK